MGGPPSYCHSSAIPFKGWQPGSGIHASSGADREEPDVGDRSIGWWPVVGQMLDAELRLAAESLSSSARAEVLA